MYLIAKAHHKMYQKVIAAMHVLHRRKLHFTFSKLVIKEICSILNTSRVSKSNESRMDVNINKCVYISS